MGINTSTFMPGLAQTCFHVVPMLLVLLAWTIACTAFVATATGAAGILVWIKWPAGASRVRLSNGVCPLQLVNCGLSDVTIKALEARGITALFPIQKHVYEPAAAGRLFT